jgi:hypothetical protein
MARDRALPHVAVDDLFGSSRGRLHKSSLHPAKLQKRYDGGRSGHIVP